MNVPFAIMPDGLFRLAPADFGRLRHFKDFLLAPVESILEDISFLPLTSLEKLLAKS